MTLGKSFGLPSMRVLGENAKFNVRANFYNIFNKHYDLYSSNVNQIYQGSPAGMRATVAWSF